MHCLFLFLSLFLSGCFVANEVEVKSKKASKAKAKENFLPVSVSNVEVINNQVVISGKNLESINHFLIKDGGVSTTLQIESKTTDKIIANTMSHVTFAAGKIFDFILSNAEASSAFTVNFSLCDSSLGGKGFNCLITPNDKEVLSYDAASGKWKPRAINGLSYQGAWDATDPFPSTTAAGDYFIVSVAAGAYGIGDWIVFNGAGFDHIVNSTTITNVFGRTGTISANEADYVLDKMGDVDLTTTPPLTGDFLRFNGTNWVPAVIPGGNPGTVTSVSASAPLSVTNATSTPALTITQATTSTNGYLSSTDWNTFNNKQPAITVGTTAQYYRGDKTWQTLDSSVVPENVNLYFTNARVLGVPLTGFTASGSAIVSTDTVLQALGKAQGQINNLTTGGSNYLVKNGTDSISGQVTVGTIGSLLLTYTPTNATDATNKSYVDTKLSLTGGTLTGNLNFKDSGSNTVTIQAPTTVTSSYSLTLPQSVGSANQVLTTDATGALSWSSPSTSATPSGIAGGDLAGTYPNPTVPGLANKISTTLNSGNILVGNGTNVATAVSVSGDATLANTGALTLKNTGTAGTYIQVTTDSQGRVTSGSNPTTLAGYGITDAVTSVSVTAPVTNSGSALAPVIGMAAATNAVNGYLTFTDWNTFNNKQPLITSSSNLNTALVAAGEIQLKELAVNGSNYVALKAPDDVTANVTYTLPAVDGSSGQVLTTNASGGLSWTTVVTGSSSLSGDIGGTTGANTIGAGKVTLTHLSATGTPSASTYLRGNNTWSSLSADVQSLLLSSYTLGANAVLSASDSVVTAFGKLQKQITDLAASAVGGDLTGTLPNPTIAKLQGNTVTTASVVNKNVLKYNGSAWVNSMISASDLSASGTTDGTTYLAGDNTWKDFNTNVSAASLIGLSTTGITYANSPLLATDSISTAFNKLRFTQNDYISKSSNQTIYGTLAINSLTGFITVPTPVNANEAANKGYVDSFGQWTLSGSDIYRSSGNVGIGTSTPAAKLQVGAIGAGQINEAYFAGVYGSFEGAYVGNYSNNGGAKIDFNTHTSSTDSSSWRILHDTDTYGAGNLVYAFAGAQTNRSNLIYSEKMRIDSNGRVGIGTTTAGSPLTVNGIIESLTGGVKFPNGTIQTTTAGGTGYGSSSTSPGVSCLDILSRKGSTGNGAYWIDPLGSGTAFQVYCDMTTDGGGWTVFYGSDGSDGLQPLVSNTEVAGNPLSFGAYNLNQTKKIAISVIAKETIIIRPSSIWLKFNRAMFDSMLSTANRHRHYTVELLASDGTEAIGYAGWTNFIYTAGGDFEIGQNPIDHHNTTTYYHLNSTCTGEYFYNYSATTPDSDASYKAGVALGSWSATGLCVSSEGSGMTFYVGMR